MYKKGKDKHLSGSTIKSECITYLDDIINSKNYTDDYIGRELKSLIKRLEDKVHQRIVIFPIDNLVLPNCKVDLGSGELVPSSQIENEFGEKMHETAVLDMSNTPVSIRPFVGRTENN